MITLQKLNESRKIEKAIQGAFKKKGQDILTVMFEQVIDSTHDISGEMSTLIDYDDTSESYQRGCMNGLRMAIIQKLVSHLEHELRLQQRASPLHWFQITSTRKDIL
jgi:hypothetical protein